MTCSTCGKATRKLELQDATVYVCADGHTTEQPRLFVRDSVEQGLQGDLFKKMEVLAA